MNDAWSASSSSSCIATASRPPTWRCSKRLLRDARTWTLTELANRGIRDTMIVACDGLPGLPQAIEAT